MEQLKLIKSPRSGSAVKTEKSTWFDAKRPSFQSWRLF